MSDYKRDVDPEWYCYARLVAHSIHTLVRDLCQRAATGHKTARWVRDELAADEGCVYWAEAIGIAWPPPLPLIADTVSALRRGERVWIDQLIDL